LRKAAAGASSSAPRPVLYLSSASLETRTMCYHVTQSVDGDFGVDQHIGQISMLGKIIRFSFVTKP
jgi:hypothetical protein